jgi:MerR family transcriptional regulator, light-induced transcriptional regulator
MPESGRLRIGELSRRVGESPELLRAWETRYGLVTPERTAGGLRLYSEQDQRRVQVMRHHIDAGLSASEAARLAKATEVSPGQNRSANLAEIELDLERGCDALDESAAQAALDRLLVAVGIRAALSEVILPFLHRLGLRWADAEASVAQEHFASHVIGGRLRGLTRGWGEGVGPRVVLACPPGELHDLGLVSFGLVLRECGWRITYMGAETPLGEIAAALDQLSPAIVVLAAVTPERFLDSARELTELAARVRVGIAGAGASADLADVLGAQALVGELTEAAAALKP